MQLVPNTSGSYGCEKYFELLRKSSSTSHSVHSWLRCFVLHGKESSLRTSNTENRRLTFVFRGQSRPVTTTWGCSYASACRSHASKQYHGHGEERPMTLSAFSSGSKNFSPHATSYLKRTARREKTEITLLYELQ